jgi:hypothetical protein
MHPVRAAADEIFRANRFQRRFHRVHERLVLCGIPDLDIEYHIGWHGASEPVCKRPAVASEAEPPAKLAGSLIA